MIYALLTFLIFLGIGLGAFVGAIVIILFVVGFLLEIFNI